MAVWLHASEQLRYLRADSRCVAPLVDAELAET